MPLYHNLIIGTISAIICLIFAYMIWYKKKTWLVSGYTEVKKKDKFAKCMGIFSIITGVYWFVFFAFINNITSNITLVCIFAYVLLTTIFRIVVFIKIK